MDEKTTIKYSLLEDIDIRLAKKAYERNKKLQVDTQVVKDLFEKAGRVLDKSTVDAVADKIFKRYFFGDDAKMRQLLRDKLYAFYTYASREDAVDAQIALYGYEVSKDIVAMSKEVSDFNIYDEFGECIYDIIAADLINEYANTTIVQAPQRLKEEHDRIVEEHQKAIDGSERKEKLHKELYLIEIKLAEARELYVKCYEEIKKLDDLIKKIQIYYKKKFDRQVVSRNAKSIVYSLRSEQNRIIKKYIIEPVKKERKKQFLIRLKKILLEKHKHYYFFVSSKKEKIVKSIEYSIIEIVGFIFVPIILVITLLILNSFFVGETRTTYGIYSGIYTNSSPSNYTYLLNPETNIIHRYNCYTIKHKENFLRSNDYDEAIGKGYRPCEVCDPE